MTGARVLAVLNGEIKPLGSTVSGIGKLLAPGPQRVEELGIVGDSQADLRVHGGADKAVHCYAWSHYETWSGELPDHPLLHARGLVFTSAPGWPRYSGRWRRAGGAAISFAFRGRSTCSHSRS